MSLLDQQETDMYTSAIFGENAMRFAGRIVLQEQGTQQGRAVTAMVGALVGEARSAFAIENNCPHEMIECEIIIRPIRKFAGRDHVGTGLAGLVTGGAMYPSEWTYQSFPNPGPNSER